MGKEKVGEGMSGGRKVGCVRIQLQHYSWSQNIDYLSHQDSACLPAVLVGQSKCVVKFRVM